MEIIRVPRITQDTCLKHRMEGRSLGFVPTMGALHAGHLSLVKRARAENDFTVVSIFVNPIQFGPSEDLSSYPRNIEEDIALLRKEEVDLLFLPDDAAMYPEGFSTHVDVEHLSAELCGTFRPGHFRGVATVVAKLFNIVQPVRAYFGLKDFQQTAVVRRMVRDLNMNIDVVLCPTVREHDGLAMSSRNRYLSAAERQAAPVVFRALSAAADGITAGMTAAADLRRTMTAVISNEPLVTTIEYASVYDPETLAEIDRIGREVLLAAAVRIGKTRLIDNILVSA
jgi:pantoate--beta-alanine ligase